MHQFVEVIDLEKLARTVSDFVFPTKKVAALYEPDVNPYVHLKIHFEDFDKPCEVLVWHTGKFVISGGSLPLIDKGTDFMFEYLNQNKKFKLEHEQY
mgnify:FL=1